MAAESVKNELRSETRLLISDVLSMTSDALRASSRKHWQTRASVHRKTHEFQT